MYRHIFIYCIYDFYVFSYFYMSCMYLLFLYLLFSFFISRNSFLLAFLIFLRISSVQQTTLCPKIKQRKQIEKFISITSSYERRLETWTY